MRGRGGWSEWKLTCIAWQVGHGHACGRRRDCACGVPGCTGAAASAAATAAAAAQEQRRSAAHGPPACAPASATGDRCRPACVEQQPPPSQARRRVKRHPFHRRGCGWRGGHGVRRVAGVSRRRSRGRARSNQLTTASCRRVPCASHELAADSCARGQRARAWGRLRCAQRACTRHDLGGSVQHWAPCGARRQAQSEPGPGNFCTREN